MWLTKSSFKKWLSRLGFIIFWPCLNITYHYIVVKQRNAIKTSTAWRHDEMAKIIQSKLLFLFLQYSSLLCAVFWPSVSPLGSVSHGPDFQLANGRIWKNISNEKGVIYNVCIKLAQMWGGGGVQWSVLFKIAQNLWTIILT